MNNLTPTQEEIAIRAYHLFLEGGCVHGRDQEYWFQAEKELGAKFFTPPAEEASEAPAKEASAPAPTPAKKAAKKAAAKKAVTEKPAAAKKAPAKKAAKK